jgi:DHA1 family quinolone resistance protein-like MFS transporter
VQALGTETERKGEDVDGNESNSPIGLRPGLVYMLANAGINAASVFVPKIAHDSLGADLFTTGVIVSMSNVLGFFSTFLFGRYADVHGLRKVLRLGLLLTGLTILLQILAHDAITLIAVRALIGLCSGMYPAALISYASKSKIPLGRFSSFLALGWALGSILAGAGTYFYSNGYASVFIIGSAMLLISYLGSLALPIIQETKHKIPLFPKEIIKKNAHVYFPYLIRHLGASTVWAIFPLYLTVLGKGVEHIDLWIGVIYFTNAFFQFVFMPFMDRVKGARSLIQAGLVFSVAIFVIFIFVPDIYIMLIVQVILAFSWSLLYVGSLRELMETNPEKATSSGLLTSVISLANVIGPLLGGVIAGTVAHFYGDRNGYVATLCFAAVVSFVALILFHLTSGWKKGK